MPLYEDPSKKRKAPEQDFGKCAQHLDSPSVAKCSRCDAPVCQTCRTRWHEEVVCPQCVDNSLADDEPSPLEAQMQTKQAWFSVILAVAGWMVLLMTLAPFSTFHQTPVKPILVFLTYFLFLVSFLPALFALGFAVAAMRLRGDFGKLALGGLICAGSQLGLAIGVIVINLWHN
jgi:hypothetical protein